MFDCSRFQTETEMLPPEFIPADVLQLLVFLINHRCRFNPGLNPVNAGLRAALCFPAAFRHSDVFILFSCDGD